MNLKTKLSLSLSLPLPLPLPLALSLSQVSSFFVSSRRRFNLDEVLREWAAEQVASSRDQREPRPQDPAPPGEDEVRPRGASGRFSIQLNV